MRFFLIALLVGISGVLHAQNSLTGRVADHRNNPLPGVSVYAIDSQKSTSTDKDGIYSLQNLPSGKTTIIFSAAGFKSVEKNILINDRTSLDVVMIESEHQIDEIIVSTVFNKLQSQNVTRVEHTSVKQMQQHGVVTLAEGITTLPGVAQVSTGTAIGKPVIRGLSGNRVLVYSQGVRLENQQFGDEHGLGLNDSGVESVEVIKGPASLLYGSDALGGVLYFNPEKFAGAKSVNADFSQKLFSNTIGSQSSLGVKGSTENWKFLARGGYSTHADYSIPGGDRVVNTRYNETDFKTAVGYSNSSLSTVFRYNFGRLNTGLPEGEFDSSHDRSPEYPRQEVNSQIFSLHTDFFIGNAKLATDFGYTINDRSEFEDSNDPALRMKLHTLSYNLKYHFAKKGGFETIAGIQGLTQTNRNSGEEFLIPDADMTDFGIFVTSLYNWKKHLLQAGLRYDLRQMESQEHGTPGDEGYFAATDRSFSSVNASLGYKTDLATDFILRLNVASGFRSPNLAELTSNGVHEGTNRYEIGNVKLDREQNIQTDLNLQYDGTHFEFFANAFYNHIDNYIYAAPTGETLDEHFVFRYTQSDAKLYGGEIGVHLHPHPLDWLHIESSFETVRGERRDNQPLPLIPANRWNNTLRTEFKSGKWLTEGYARLNVSTTFDQNNVSEFETQTGGYTLINAGFGGKIKLGKTAFDASISGTNLFDRTYVSHLSRLKQDGIPNMGRNIILSVGFAL